MPTIPKIRSFLKQAKYEAPYTTQTLALHATGTGCSRPTSPRISSFLIPTNCNRILHQVDRSCAFLQSHWTISGQVLMAESCMSFWPTAHHLDNGQQGGSYLLLQVQDRPQILYAILSIGQLSSQNRQSQYP